MSSITTRPRIVAYIFPLVKRHGVRSVIRKPGSEAVKDVDPAMRDRADGSLRSLLARLARLDVRVVPFCGIGDPTSADSILDRLARNAHRIEVRAKSS